MIRILIVVMAFQVWSPLVFAADLSRFYPWSENVYIQIEKDFGSAGAQRVRRLQQLMLDNQEQPIEAKLKLVNDTLNLVPWISDRAKYHAQDYWATPLETVATFGGDCEDIAIAKYVVLRAMGIPGENMELLYVKLKKTGAAHMALVYTPRPDLPLEQQTLLVLGSIDPRIRDVRDRKDILIVYLLDFKQNVALISEKNGQQRVLSPWHHSRAKKMEKVKAAMRSENAKYLQYNEGRQLY